MALAPIDRDLLDSLLSGETDAWPVFVDRTLGLVTHVVTHAADCRGMSLSASDREDLIADVFVALLERDMAALRQFQRRSSLATYVAVIARRRVVKQLMRRAGQTPLASVSHQLPADVPDGGSSVEERLADQDQVAQMLGGLPEAEAQVVRMFHLEGRTYQEISRVIGVPENTIGPVLSRARLKLRRQGEPM